MILKIKYFRQVALMFFVFVSLCLVMAAAPAGKKTCTMTKNYAVSIHGTSNIHAWEEKVMTVTGDGMIAANSTATFDLERLSIHMLVHSFKSDMGAAMNSNTWKALKADEYPEIIFILKLPVKSVAANTGEKPVQAKGTLSIAGVTRFVSLQGMISLDENNMSFRGSHNVKMSDYGVDPPTALFGTLKTGDEITIKFKVNFAMQPPA